MSNKNKNKKKFFSNILLVTRDENCKKFSHILYLREFN